MKAIVATDSNGGIAKNGKIPWKSKEDMKWFRSKTWGKKCLKGSKTLVDKALEERHVIVLSSQRAPACVYDQHIRSLWQLDPRDDIMCIGGADTYKSCMHLINVIYMTIIPKNHKCDTFFPTLNPDAWVVHEIKQDGKIFFLTLVRRGANEPEITADISFKDSISTLTDGIIQ